MTGLFDAGVDINKYAAKTTHHAASSKAFFAGVSIDTVMLRARWTNVYSFVIHYNLPVVSKDRAKQEAAAGALQSISIQIPNFILVNGLEILRMFVLVNLLNLPRKINSRKL